MELIQQLQEKTDALIEEIKAILKIRGSRTSQHTKSAVNAVEKTFEADMETFIREFAKLEKQKINEEVVAKVKAVRESIDQLHSVFS